MRIQEAGHPALEQALDDLDPTQTAERLHAGLDQAHKRRMGPATATLCSAQSVSQ
ncbi:hypothetical protein [Streptomyces sp. XY413]|uniref:hypothetical protein n=1 Tax=Streptomyces sp. XY413 TaxID=1519479 RepID=UPI000A8E1B3E|nr:hypothetical protein [Streptomyces sp. XY413]